MHINIDKSGKQFSNIPLNLMVFVMCMGETVLKVST